MPWLMVAGDSRSDRPHHRRARYLMTDEKGPSGSDSAPIIPIRPAGDDEALRQSMKRHPAGNQRITEPWDPVHNRAADIYTPPEDIIERPTEGVTKGSFIRITVHGLRVYTETHPNNPESWEGIQALLNLGFRVTLQQLD
jgi:hypothetical protein